MERLSWGDTLRSGFVLLMLESRLLFHRKIIVIAAGIPIFYGALYALAVFRPFPGFSVSSALHVLVEIPAVVLAIYLSMDLVGSERERGTLELLYSVSASNYLVWTGRMLVVYLLMGCTVLIMSALAYVLFAEFPFFLGGLNACLPAFLVANLTLLLAAVFRSSNTAGMLSSALALALLIIGGNLPASLYSPFLNPFVPPVNIDLFIWEQTVIINRVGMFLLAALVLYAALRRLDRRERILT